MWSEKPNRVSTNIRIGVKAYDLIKVMAYQHGITPAEMIRKLLAYGIATMSDTFKIPEDLRM